MNFYFTQFCNILNTANVDIYKEKNTKVWKIKICENLLSHFFDKNSVKATILP